MYTRAWFCDLEKAVAAFRNVVKADLFCRIEGNYFGDFVITLNEGESYTVRHTDFTVWRLVGPWGDGHWEEVK